MFKRVSPPIYKIGAPRRTFSGKKLTEEERRELLDRIIQARARQKEEERRFIIDEEFID